MALLRSLRLVDLIKIHSELIVILITTLNLMLMYDMVHNSRFSLCTHFFSNSFKLTAYNVGKLKVTPLAKVQV